VDASEQLLRANPTSGSLEALDRATLALYEKVRSSAATASLLTALERIDTGCIQTAAGLRIVLVPGILYRDYPETGADGAVLKEIAERLSIPFDVVPVDGTEGLEAAADLIVEFLTALPAGAPLLVFSLSKGSAEFRYAVAKQPGHAAFRSVRAWVSVSGLPLGTPSVELVLSRRIPLALFSLWFWFKRWKLAKVRHLLLHRPGAQFHLPAHVRFIQVAAFPLQADLQDARSRRLRQRLAAFGPNDGFAVLSELAELPGTVYPLRGVDHYLHGVADLSDRITRLVAYLGKSALT
jgi:hypothetical protein